MRVREYESMRAGDMERESMEHESRRVSEYQSIIVIVIDIASIVLIIVIIILIIVVVIIIVIIIAIIIIIIITGLIGADLCIFGLI